MFDIFGWELSWFEAAGWIGTILLILAYFLLSTEVIREGMLFQVLNVIGATGLLLSAVEKQNYPAVVLEIAWILIGGYAIGKILRRLRRTANPG